MKKYNIDEIAVHRDNDGNVYGNVSCVLCSVKCRIASKISGEKRYWTLSNYQRHLTKSHKLKRAIGSKNGNAAKDVDKLNEHVHDDMDDKDEATAIDNMKDSAIVDTITTTDELITDDLNKNDATVIEDMVIVDETYNTDKLEDVHQTTVMLEIESLQSLESCIYDQISKQTLKMTEACLQHNDASSEMIFKINDKDCSLDIAQIPKDGNCMFGAMTHQLFGFRVDSEDKKKLLVSCVLKSSII